jgi:hypothetical protein
MITKVGKLNSLNYIFAQANTFSHMQKLCCFGDIDSKSIMTLNTETFTV